MEDFVLAVVIPMVVGGVLTYAMSGLKFVWTWLDKQNAWVQRGVTAALAYGAVWVAAHIGVPVPENILTADGETVTAVLSAAFAFLYHKLRKQSA